MKLKFLNLESGLFINQPVLPKRFNKMLWREAPSFLTRSLALSTVSVCSLKLIKLTYQ